MSQGAGFEAAGESSVASRALSDSEIAELRRLRSLYTLDLVGGSDEGFDRFGAMAARIFEVPIALVTVLDDDEQWFCAAFGTDLDRHLRAESFCTRIVDDELPILVVEDTHVDERFKDLPPVIDEPWVRFYAGAPVHSQDDQPIGTLCVMDVVPRTFDDAQRRTLRDLADLVENEIHHRTLALTDVLTGLANRRAFLAAAPHYLALGARRNEPVTFLFCDIDGLKTVNDTAGHSQGDALLERAAAVLTTATPPASLVARIGGDEFAIALFAVDASGVAAVVDRLHRAVNESNEAGDGPTLTISFGSATSGQDGTSVSELMAAADAAMYDGRSDRSARRSR